MLQANKAELIAKLSVEALKIRQYELDYWLSVYAKLGTLSAILSGFAASVRRLDIFRRTSYVYIHAFFLYSTGGAIGFYLLLLAVCTLCILWAPGRALRGQGIEAYDKVIALLKDTYGFSEWLFEAGLISYIVSAILASFCILKFSVALLVTVCLTIFYVFVRRQQEYLKMAFVPSTATSSRLDTAATLVNNIGSLIGQEDTHIQGRRFHPQFASQI